MDLQGMKGNSKIYLIIILVAVGLIFILQNFEQTSFQFLIWTILTGPKWIIIALTFAIGMAFGYLLAKKKD